MDLTLKALSIMFKKSIMVIAEDFLWLSHTRPFENFNILYILFKGCHFASVTSWDGSVIHCEMLVIKSFTSASNSCADKMFDHKILNRSDVAKSQFIATLHQGNCTPVVSTDVDNSMQENRESCKINQADIDTTDPNRNQESTFDDISNKDMSEVSTKEGSMLDEKKLDALTLTPNVLQSSQSLKSDFNVTKEGKCDNKENSLPVCQNNVDTYSEAQGDNCHPMETRVEVSSEIQSTPNIPSVCSSNKETSFEGDTTLTANSPARGKFISINLYVVTFRAVVKKYKNMDVSIY